MTAEAATNRIHIRVAHEKTYSPEATVISLLLSLSSENVMELRDFRTVDLNVLLIEAPVERLITHVR